MALINCPECNKEISDKANACINCGYPLTLIEKVKININCKYCNAKCKSDDDYCDACGMRIKPYPIADQKAVFKKFSYQPQIKCPTCNSKDVVKISTSAKVVNIAMFGLLGNKRKKQFHCNNCNYYW